MLETYRNVWLEAYDSVCPHGNIPIESHWSSTFFNHPHSAWIFRTTRISDHDWITWPMPKVVSGHGSRVTSSWSARDPLAFSLAHVSQSAWKRLADRVQSQPRHLKMASCHGVWGLPWLVGYLQMDWFGAFFVGWDGRIHHTKWDMWRQ